MGRSATERSYVKRKKRSVDGGDAGDSVSYFLAYGFSFEVVTLLIAAFIFKKLFELSI